MVRFNLMVRDQLNKHEKEIAQKRPNTLITDGQIFMMHSKRNSSRWRTQGRATFHTFVCEVTTTITKWSG